MKEPRRAPSARPRRLRLWTATVIVFANDAVAVLQKVQQQIEHLRLDSDGLRSAAKFAAVAIKHMISKEQLH